MYKRARQHAIKEIVGTEQIANQPILVEKLCEMGFEATVSTISRDIAELGLVKSRNGYSMPEAAYTPASPRQDFSDVLRSAVTKISNPTESNLLVVKTLDRWARTVASALDSCNYEEIVGTVGSGDTVLIVTTSIDSVKSL